ncbi:MAG: VCBS repeat-containing protein, partial [candidate division Zixibacteria bacterium]
DLASANPTDDSVTVWMGDGDGTFSSRSDYSVGDGPVYIIAEDFDGDNETDLAVLCGSDSVTVLTNDGDGTFTMLGSFFAGSDPMGFFAVDLDSDGDLDLVTSNPSGDSVTVLYNFTNCCTGIRGNADGDPNNVIDTFDVAVIRDYLFYSGPLPDCALEGDVDGDSDIDLFDLIDLANYVTGGTPTPASCP